MEPLDPLRIASIPGVTLDVVVKGQLSEKELSLESLHDALPGSTPQEKSIASQIPDSNPVSTVRRNPAGGLVEVAMDAYRNNDNPNFSPWLRGPQAILDDPSPPSTGVATPASQKSVSISQTSTGDPTPTSQKPASISQAPLLPKSASITNNIDGETMRKAESGDKDAQFFLGHKYYHAQGVPQDYQTAMDWFFKAADQGHICARHEVGWLYHHGHGVPQDYSLAMDWYLKAAKQGHAPAQSNIGDLYAKGHGVPQDYSLAKDWYLKAAYQGHPAAQNNIGWLYQNGCGVPQDHSSAMDWYLKAANHGHARAQVNIGMLYASGLGVPQNYSQAMIWFRKAADLGDPLALNNVGWFYEHGLGVSKDRVKAIEWYRKAIAGGHADARLHLDRLEQQSIDSDATDTKRGLFKKLFK
ncbi:hypothetical protein BGZ95_011679 [Linnemannia exigua]|uniref:HCP-like protein n=1 Tax=Linnemannia exigua TaxID=604196 RepID=A0AAD4D9L9_9FUNG|nr:hypothetical protein BGZ95_011679 [Linnemannia exigua]